MDAAAKGFSPILYRTRFPALDGLRALAVTMVFAEHYAGGAHGGRILQLINALRLRGWIGVDLFFVLSGFLITGILYDTQRDSHFFLRFFARRSLRIFPVFYLAMTLLLLLTPIAHYHWRTGHLLFFVYLGNVWANHDGSLYGLYSQVHPVMTATLSHLWSLCVEEQFYLLWPVAVWLIRDRVKLLWTAGALSVLGLILRIAFLHAVGPQVGERWIMRTLPFRMDALLIGGMLALLLRGPAAAAWQRRCAPTFAACLVTIATGFLLAPTYDAPWLLTVGLTVIACACAALIGMALQPASLTARVFAWEPLRILGRYSYGFYVYHLLFRLAWIQLLIWLGAHLHSLAWAGIFALTLNYIVTFLAAKLSFDWFEVRFLRSKPHFAYDSERAASSREAPSRPAAV